MILAGVLDWLNDGGGAILGIVVVVSVAYFLAHMGFQLNRCQAKSGKTGEQCRLALRHRPRSRHTTWKGETFYT